MRPFKSKEISRRENNVNSKMLVRAKDVYGRQVYYPADETARAIAAIAGDKTLTPRVLRLAQALGYEIEIARPLPTWRKT